jgi:uncharacterized protein YbjT (DUF2867 family)
MRVAVVGATGRVGAPIVAALERQGHDVLAMHRGSATHPVDLVTGDGLAAALAGVEVVVNAADGPWRNPAPVLVEGTRRLLAASDAHHVCVSIVGLDALAPLHRYYQSKLAQEQLVIASGRPYSIVRCTQFHEFLGPLALRLGRARIELRSAALVAPISAREAGVVIARTAAGQPTLATANLCGPETLTVSQLRARRGVWLPLVLAPRLSRALAAGALTHPAPDVRGVLTYPQWMSEARGRPWRPAPRR